MRAKFNKANTSVEVRRHIIKAGDSMVVESVTYHLGIRIAALSTDLKTGQIIVIDPWVKQEVITLREAERHTSDTRLLKDHAKWLDSWVKADANLKGLFS